MPLDVATLFNKLSSGLEKITLEEGHERYIVEEDLLLSRAQLRSYARAYVKERSAPREERIKAVAMRREDGSLIKQRDPRDISYCVRRHLFTSHARYVKAVSAMREAASAWERACDVRFVHERSLDSHEGERDALLHAWGVKPRPANTVQFVVREAPFQRPIAAGFLPVDDIGLIDRHILLCQPWFADDLIFDPVGILRHELGHVLGFRHEQIHGDAPPACPREHILYTSARTYPLTAYDPKSVMHYYCAESGTRSLQLTEVDRLGAQKLYGPPRASAR